MNRTNHHSRVKTELRNKSALQMYMQAGIILKRMEGNPHFPLPQPDVERVAVYRNQLGEVIKQDNTAYHLAQRNEAQKKLARAISTLASRVQCVSRGDAQVILTTGFDVRRRKTKAHLLAAPLTKRYVKLSKPGCVKLMWHANTKSVLYNIYITEDFNPSTRKFLTSSTKSSCVIEGLESGRKYQLEVCAVNSAGEGALSQAITVYEVWLWHGNA